MGLVIDLHRRGYMEDEKPVRWSCMGVLLVSGASANVLIVENSQLNSQHMNSKVGPLLCCAMAYNLRVVFRIHIQVPLCLVRNIGSKSYGMKGKASCGTRLAVRAAF